ncbi:hypothetical protein LX36DRAFT_194382 [Colletotrichum falcatum]|nr:hypothetical protein LX36DRAFT_194382 [Colletotrichum falcatum]
MPVSPFFLFFFARLGRNHLSLSLSPPPPPSQSRRPWIGEFPDARRGDTTRTDHRYSQCVVDFCRLRPRSAKLLMRMRLSGVASLATEPHPAELLKFPPLPTVDGPSQAFEQQQQQHFRRVSCSQPCRAPCVLFLCAYRCLCTYLPT